MAARMPRGVSHFRQYRDSHAQSRFQRTLFSEFSTTRSPSRGRRRYILSARGRTLLRHTGPLIAARWSSTEGGVSRLLPANMKRPASARCASPQFSCFGMNRDHVGKKTAGSVPAGQPLRMGWMGVSMDALICWQECHCAGRRRHRSRLVQSTRSDSEREKA